MSCEPWLLFFITKHLRLLGRSIQTKCKQGVELFTNFELSNCVSVDSPKVCRSPLPLPRSWGTWCLTDISSFLGTYMTCFKSVGKDTVTRRGQMTKKIFMKAPSRQQLKGVALFSVRCTSCGDRESKVEVGIRHLV